ncbi:MAG: CYTH domain-containing protein [Candidatus Saccharimonadales bacterium]
MKTEFEAKFCNVNHDEIRARLKALGGVLAQPMRLMKRVTIDNEFMKTGKDAFVRIRDEGNKVTITYKQFDDLSVDGAKEIEIIVDDFDSAVNLFAEVGLPYRSFQESKRETWSFKGAEVVLDEWPWLKPYIEIEAESEEHVQAIAQELGFDWSNAVFGDVMAAYRLQYPHLTEKDTVGNIPRVSFDDPLPELFTSR